MASLDRLTATQQQALTLACEAFSDATHHYRAAPTTANEKKDLAHARVSASYGADAWIRFTVAGKRFDMPVVINAGTRSLGASIIVNRMLSRRAPNDARPLMLVTQHITSRMADDLIAQGIPFLDTAGNAYLQEPEATIMIVGRDKPALNLKEPTSRSTTPKGLRVTFALLTQPGLVHAPYRTIADRSAVALNTVNVAMDDLMYRGLVVHKGARRVIADRRRLIEEWVSLFPTRLRPKLSPRRFTSWTKESNWWSRSGVLDLDARLSGEAGADILTHEIKPASLTIYSHGGVTPRLMMNGMLRPDERGNVEVLETFWPAKAEEGWNLPYREVVHPLLVYSDLITSGDDRNRAVAQTIYDRYLAKERA
ncbi:type IV toxin-antitoxin system AbiEi family antitoxin [Burkholderia pseudomallei]|uniref:type IV toxin-antitoxin system AbiEi family antitoxin n=1 Tax=Burkholderia pseudomallei TaxID=28450 RepID=UPI0018DDBC7B|nr:type IV toxin-antitoxin system AbiEi family antitoxin [Burkholderia pseudomallei]MBH9659381.1 type IV toxin-antitoxin system AbiEi family antitoxin [Burkholderia pseudomallei]